MREACVARSLVCPKYTLVTSPLLLHHVRPKYTQAPAMEATPHDGSRFMENLLKRTHEIYCFLVATFQWCERSFCHLPVLLRITKMVVRISGSSCCWQWLALYSILWNNKNIRIDNKPVFYKKYFNNDIQTVVGLRFVLSNTSYELIASKIRKTNFLEWIGLRHSVPSNLKAASWTAGNDLA